MSLNKKFLQIAMDLVKAPFINIQNPIIQLPEPKPYQQPPNSIPHLFVDKQEQHSTTKWLHLLTLDPVYRYCQVVSLTYAKAAASPLAHEFLQFIVEDTRNGTRTRVFSDRTNTNADEPDRVLVGRDWSSSTNPSDQPDLPMPLISLTFTGQRPSVVDIANLLACTTALAPKYRLKDTMCWWYASTVLTSANGKFGGTLKEWRFASSAYNFTILNNLMVNEALQFKQQDIESMTFAVPCKYRERVTVSAILLSPGMQKEYEEAMQIDDTEKLDPELLKSSVENAVQNMEKQAAELPALLEEYKHDSDELIKEMLNTPDRDRNLEAFDAALEKNVKDGNSVYLRIFSGTGQEDQEFDMAMRCLVGEVLRSVNEKEKKQDCDA